MDKRRTGTDGLRDAAAPLRAVGVLRISKRSDASTTIERHQKYISEACQRKGWIVVGWAIDRGVSATTKSPFDRPQLGEWLKRPDDFDVLVPYRLDRISRNSQDTRDIMSWCTKQESPKRLFCVSQEMIDFDPTNESFLAKMAVEIFMAFATAHAQMEVENMGERWSDLKESAREIGYWSGGPAPYGFMTETGRLPDAAYDGKLLRRDPDTYPILERIIFEFHEEGRRTTDIAADLNADSIPSPMAYHRARYPHVLEARGDDPYTNSTQWQSQTVRRILKNRILIGESESRGEVIRNRQRIAVRFTDPTISRETYVEILARLSRSPRGRHSDRSAESLSGLATCLACGSGLKYQYSTTTKNGRLYEYHNYRCSDGAQMDGDQTRCKIGAKGIATADVHAAVDKAMEKYGAAPLYHSVVIPGSGSHEEIERTEEAYNSLLQTHAKRIEGGGLMPKMEEIFQAQLDQLEARYRFLVEQGVTPPRLELVDTGRTVALEWAGATWEKRRQILEMAGIHVGVDLPTREVHVWDDGGAEDRLRLWGEGSEVPARHAAMIAASEKGA